MILNPQTVWPVWPGCAILVSILLLVRGKIWPILIPAAFATFALYDLEVGVPIKSIAWFIPANTIQVLTSALCLRYCFHGIPRLNSAKAIAKYSFFAVILAPFLAAFFSAYGIEGSYWEGWRVCFLSEALAFVTLTPAILSWSSEGSAFVRKPRTYHLEAVALIAGLILLSYLIFAESGRAYSPALLYSLIPLLLWAALRFGSIGISSSAVLVSFIAIWGAIHVRGPFADQGSLKGMLSLQLFLVFAALPFMVLAALAEERKIASRELKESEERFRLAAQAGKIYAYEWDVATDRVTRSEEHVNVLGFSDGAKQLTRQQLLARVHRDDRALFVGAVDQVSPEYPTTHITYRLLRPDGSVVWLEKNARAFFDEQGKVLRMIGMVADITERKQAEEALRESEDKLRLLLDSTAEAIYGMDLEGRCTFCNPACLRALGYERVDEVLGKNMHDLIHHTRADGTLFPVEECQVFRAFRTGEGVHVDNEVLWRANGTSFPAEYWAHPQRKGQEVVGAVVAFIDITEHKLAEEALSQVSRRLIEAQEQERTRIARELHDDIGQRLALLAIKLQQFHLNSPDLSPEVRDHAGTLWKQTTEIATDIQTLSHELHSSKLQHLGIEPAIRGFCKEFSEQQNVEIDCQTHDLPSPLPPDTSLCFFRVLQEALHNSAKHSGVRHFEVRLWGASSEIHLTVSDSGSGFDSGVLKATRGLGLISMEERLKAVNGTFSIQSRPKRGTTIHARVPLSSGSDSMRAAG
jgi:PAS domain S-box-containing protein